MIKSSTKGDFNVDARYLTCEGDPWVQLALSCDSASCNTVVGDDKIRGLLL